jgi:hypothetical protein
MFIGTSNTANNFNRIACANRRDPEEAFCHEGHPSPRVSLRDALGTVTFSV